MQTVADRTLNLAEAVRRGLWRIGARTGIGRRCIRDRQARLATLFVFHVCTALVLTIVAPIWLLLLGPLLLGVPHVIGDVRFLLAPNHSPLRLRAVMALAVPLTGMLFLRIAWLTGSPLHLPAEATLGGLALGATIAFGPISWPRKAIGLAVVTALTLVMQAHAHLSALIVGHLHNFVAIGLWVWWMRREREGKPPVSTRWLLVALGSFAVGVAVLAFGVFEDFTWSIGGYHAAPAGLNIDDLAATLAPDVHPVLAVRLVAIYAFAQAVHYAIWVRLAAQSPGHTEREAPPTWRRTLQGLRHDLGRLGLAAAVLGSLALPLLAVLVDAGDVRTGYLALVLFHGWLELAVIAHLFAAGGRARG